MKVAVLDGQGGGIGKTLVEKLRNSLGAELDIVAMGTNALATSAMLKAGASEGVTGESAIAMKLQQMDAIVGCIGLLAVGSMNGEITPAIAKAVSESGANKVLIPLGKCQIHVMGVEDRPLPEYMESAVATIEGMMQVEKSVRRR